MVWDHWRASGSHLEAILVNVATTRKLIFRKIMFSKVLEPGMGGHWGKTWGDPHVIYPTLAPGGPAL